MHRAVPFALALTACLSPANARAGEGYSPAPPDGGRVAEIVTFHLKPGSDSAAFLAAARATEGPVAAQPGFLRRVLSHDGTGLWTDHVEWADRASGAGGHGDAGVRAVCRLHRDRPHDPSPRRSDVDDGRLTAGTLRRRLGPCAAPTACST